MWTDRFAGAVARFTTGRPWLALTLGVLTCVVLAVPALGVRLDSDVFRLLPDRSPTVQRFRELVTHFGASDQLFAVVESADAAPPDAGRLAAARRATDAVAARIAALRWQGPAGDEAMVLQIDGRPEPGFLPALEDQLVARSWLFLDDRGLDLVVRRLNARYVARKLALGGTPDVPPHLAARDPLGLWKDAYLPAWSERRAHEGGIARDGGWLVADHGRFHVLVLRPAHPAQERAFATAMAARAQELQAWFAAEPAHAGLTLHVAGGHLVAAADYAVAQANALSNLWQGALAVLVLFAVVYRSLRLVVFIAITLVPATVAALGLTRLLLGPELSLLAASFATVLIGLGVDFVIHLHGAFGRHLAATGDRARAAAAALVEMTPSILAGVLTTVVAFAVLGLSGFRGLRELGLVAALGLSVMLVQLLVTLPAFLARFGPRRAAATEPLAGFGPAVAARPRLVAGLSLAALAAAAVLLWHDGRLFRFDTDTRNLRPARDVALDAQRDLMARLGITGDRLQVLVSGEDGAAVLEAGGAIADDSAALARPRTMVLGEPLPPRLPATLAVTGGADEAGARLFDTPLGRLRAARVGPDRLEGLAWVGSAPSADATPVPAGTAIVRRPLTTGSPLPAFAGGSPQRQRAAMERLARDVDWAALAALPATLDDAQRARWAPFLADLAAMRQRVERRAPLTLDELAAGPLAAMTRAFYARDGATARLVARVQVPDLGAGIAVGDICAALAIAPDGGPVRTPGVTVAATGVPVMADALARALVADFRDLGLWSALAVFVLLVVLMRGLGDALLAMGALAFGTVLTLGAMAAAGLSWNIVNVAVLPLLFGIGIDASIYLINAVRRHPRDRAGVAAALGEVAHPMLMTTATAIAGFAALLWNPYRGLQSMGWTAILGMLLCLGVALFALPALFLLTSHRRARRAAAAAA